MILFFLILKKITQSVRPDTSTSSVVNAQSGEVACPEALEWAKVKTLFFQIQLLTLHTQWEHQNL